SGIERTADLGPVKRRRNRSMRFPAHRIRAYNGLDRTVAEGIQVYTFAPRGDRMFGGKELGMCCGGTRDNSLTKVEDVVSARTDTNGSEKRKPATTRCFRKRLQVQLVQQLL